MIDYDAIQEAIRTHLLTLVVATTGSTSLSATATGYARSAGSFLDDGFRAGMELEASGFGNASNNGTKVVTQATALALTCEGTATETEAAGRTLTVGLPSTRAWENEELAPGPDPEPGVPWFREQFLPGPGPTQIFTTPTARLELEPQYVAHVNTPEGWGKDAPRRYADAVARHFTPRTSIALASGDTLRVRTDTGPGPGQLIRTRPGFVTSPVAIPFRLQTPNSI